MKLLVDTHVLLWAATAPENLSSACRAALEDGSIDVHVSVVSAWEIAIKQSLGKLTLSQPAEQWLPEVLRKIGFNTLDVELAAALRVRSLPWHHRDPFDRLLIAQAMALGFTVATRDKRFADYGLSLILA